jgi:hypothetical protein
MRSKVAKWRSGRVAKQRALAVAMMAVLLVPALAVAPARAYVLNRTIAAAGGCPEPNRFNVAVAGIIDRRWSTSLNTTPETIKTTATTGEARLAEIEQTIQRSFATWASVAGSSLRETAYGALQRTVTQNACNTGIRGNPGEDGLNSICFNQSSGSFAGNVLAFTRVITSDIPGESFTGQTSSFNGEILDADILFKPDDSNITFATPSALPANPNSFDLESVLTHEIGHLLGFSHSGVLRAMMYPFAPPRGTFLGDRPTDAVPDGPLHDDDRAGLRVLYPDASATGFAGKITGRILPANPLTISLLAAPAPGEPVTGIFGSHVVAVDAATGAVVAGALGGWSCNPGDARPRFDGFYEIAGLPVGRSYKIYAEPLDGPMSSGDIANALADLCRSNVPSPCTVPALQTNFTTRSRP